MKSELDKSLILQYFEQGGVITVGNYRQPKREERTFRNNRGSIFNSSRKTITLRNQGLRGSGKA